MMSPSPIVPSEGALCGLGSDKEHPPARWECGADIKILQMNNMIPKESV